MVTQRCGTVETNKGRERFDSRGCARGDVASGAVGSSCAEPGVERPARNEAWSAKMRCGPPQARTVVRKGKRVMDVGQGNLRPGWVYVHHGRMLNTSFIQSVKQRSQVSSFDA